MSNILLTCMYSLVHNIIDFRVDSILKSMIILYFHVGWFIIVAFEFFSIKNLFI